MCSPARGKETGEKRGHGKHYARSDQSERITRTYLIKNLGEHSAGGKRQQQTDEYGERGLQSALSHDQCENVFTMRAQSHTDPDFACATRNCVRFDTVNADNSKQERDQAERAEQRGTQLHDPKSDAAIQKIDIR